MVNFISKPKTAGPTDKESLKASLATPVIAAAVVLAIVVGALIDLRNNSSSTAHPAHLFYADSQKEQLAQTDKDGKVIYQTSTKKFGFANFEAFSPDGNVLLSTGSGSTADFLFVKGNVTQKLNPSAVKTLQTAVAVNRSHNLLFTDATHVVGVTCGQSSSCKVNVVNILTDQYQEITDTGIAYSQVPAYVYPIGLAADSNSVFIRTLAANKLGKDDNSIYQVDLRSHKVVDSFKLPLSTGYSVALSPDKKDAVYLGSDIGGKTVIHVLNLANGKDSSATWSGAAIDDQPLTFQWSPDSHKILFQASDSILPRSNFDDTKPTRLTYLDVAKSSFVNLATIPDSAHHNVAFLGWLDNQTVIYQELTSQKTYDFSNAKADTKRLNIGSLKVSDQKTPGGDLVQVGFW